MRSFHKLFTCLHHCNSQFAICNAIPNKQPQFSAEREKHSSPKPLKWTDGTTSSEEIPYFEDEALFNVSSSWKLCKCKLFIPPVKDCPTCKIAKPMKDSKLAKLQALKWTDGISLTNNFRDEALYAISSGTEEGGSGPKTLNWV